VSYAIRECQLKEAELDAVALEMELDEELKNLAMLADPFGDKKSLKCSVMVLTTSKIVAAHTRYLQVLRRIEDLRRDMGHND